MKKISLILLYLYTNFCFFSLRRLKEGKEQERGRIYKRNYENNINWVNKALKRYLDFWISFTFHRSRWVVSSAAKNIISRKKLYWTVSYQAKQPPPEVERICIDEVSSIGWLQHWAELRLLVFGLRSMLNLIRIKLKKILFSFSFFSPLHSFVNSNIYESSFSLSFVWIETECVVFFFDRKSVSSSFSLSSHSFPPKTETLCFYFSPIVGVKLESIAE